MTWLPILNDSNFPKKDNLKIKEPTAKKIATLEVKAFPSLNRILIHSRFQCSNQRKLSMKFPFFVFRTTLTSWRSHMATKIKMSLPATTKGR